MIWLWLVVLLLYPATCAKTLSHQPRSARDAPQGLQRAVRAFSETWLVQGNIAEAAGYLSSGAIHSRDLTEVLRERGEPISPQAARKVFAGFLTDWRAVTGDPKSLSEAIVAVPVLDNDLEVLNRNTPESKWYNLIVLDEGTARGIAPNKDDANWLVSELGRGKLFAQTFKLRSTTEGDMGPLVFIWRSEPDSWRILLVTTAGM